MTTFYRGQRGLEEHIIRLRNDLTARLEKDERPRERRTDVRMTRAERMKIEGSVNALNGILGDLGVGKILTEDEYDRRFKIGGPGSPGEAGPSVTLTPAPETPHDPHTCGQCAEAEYTGAGRPPNQTREVSDLDITRGRTHRMTEYRVTVTRDATESITVNVTADSPEDAEALALELVGTGNDFVWIPDEGNVHEPYISAPGEAEEVTMDQNPEAL